MLWYKQNCSEYESSPEMNYHLFGIYIHLKELIASNEKPIRVDCVPRSISDKELKELESIGKISIEDGLIIIDCALGTLENLEKTRDESKDRMRKHRLKHKVTRNNPNVTQDVTRNNPNVTQDVTRNNPNVTHVVLIKSREEKKEKKEKKEGISNSTSPKLLVKSKKTAAKDAPTAHEPPTFSETSFSDSVKELIEKYIECQKQDGKKIPNIGGYRKTLTDQFLKDPKTEKENFESYIFNSEKKQSSEKSCDDISLLYNYDSGYGHEWDTVRSMSERGREIYREMAVSNIPKGSEMEINLEMCKEYRRDKNETNRIP